MLPPRHARTFHPRWRHDLGLPSSGEGTILPYGQGRSYGDVCQNPGGSIVTTEHLNRLIAFDPQRGRIRCEAGCTIEQLLEFLVPRGWFLPVVPGTQHVSIGGAIANDIHGKNHHHVGSFGAHVRRLELVRSTGKRIECSRTNHSDLMAATIGGLGLTGLITWAEIELKKVPGPGLEVESIPFHGLEAFQSLEKDSTRHWEYTVAWFDALTDSPDCTRGIFLRGRHASGQPAPSPPPLPKVPMHGPDWLISQPTVRLFNEAYFRVNRRRSGRKLAHYQSFFFPLDRLPGWNRLYGQRGMLQYQCVLPPANAMEAAHEVLEEIANAGEGSFLSVIKGFGPSRSPGLLSFPRPGLTLALDFPHRGRSTLDLFARLDRVVKAASGALYPAKDVRMPPEIFHSSFPALAKFQTHVDPRFSSGFWRRVMPHHRP